MTGRGRLTQLITSHVVRCSWRCFLIAVCGCNVLGTMRAQQPTQPGVNGWMDPLPSWDLSPTSIQDGRPTPTFLPSEVTVSLRHAEARDAFVAEAGFRGYTLIGEIPRLGLVKLSCPAGLELDVSEELRHWPEVAFAEPNGIGFAASLDDPCIPDQWHLENDGSSGGVAGADIDLIDAWSVSTGGPEIIVAVLDTGVEFDHPELAARLLPGYDFFYEDSDPTSHLNHGIYMAALIGAAADNGYGGAGVDQGCMILPIKVLSDLSLGSVFDIAQGVDYAVQAGANVINMSLGGYPANETLQLAFSSARAAGCILVAAAGNKGQGTADTSWPGASPDTISVGSTDHADLKAKSSLFGQALDFMAPGESVVSTGSLTWPTACFQWGGTSMSCALTSGIASLLLSVRPDLSQDDVYALLAAGAKDGIGPPDEDTPGWDQKYGYGRVSAGRSLRLLDRLMASDGALGVPDAITASKGGHQLIVARVDPRLRGSPWITLGSATGSVPGSSLGHVHLPLNTDRYFLETVAGDGALLHPAFGIVPDDGVIIQSLDVPANWQSGITTLEHVVVVVHSPMSVSNVVSLDLEP